MSVSYLIQLGEWGVAPPHYESCTARIEVGGAAGTRHITARLGLGLTLAAATGAPVRVADAVMGRLAVPVPGHQYAIDAIGRMPDEGADFPDALDWIAFLSGVTEHIAFGTGMLILPEHNPVMLAKRAATIDRLSGGRLLLGVGVGWLKEEFDALGVPWEHRGPRADEYIQVMRRLWSADEATFTGRFVQFQRVHCFPRPLQVPGIPVIIGGHTEAAAARAGRIGDGFLPCGPA